MTELEKINTIFRVFCVIGILLSSYALYVKLKSEQDENYVAYCDLNEHTSCTKALSSKYGRGFGIIGKIFGEDSKLNQPNSVPAIILYFILILLSYSDGETATKLQGMVCILASLVTIYSAYILHFVLCAFCIVCVSTYMVNAFILGLCIKKLYIISNKIEARAEAKIKSGIKGD